MNTKGELKITIDKLTGNMSVEGQNFRGDECLSAVDAFLKQVGGRGSKTRKPELAQYASHQKARR